MCLAFQLIGPILSASSTDIAAVATLWSPHGAYYASECEASPYDGREYKMADHTIPVNTMAVCQTMRSSLWRPHTQSAAQIDSAICVSIWLSHCSDSKVLALNLLTNSDSFGTGMVANQHCYRQVAAPKALSIGRRLVQLIQLCAIRQKKSSLTLVVFHLG